MHLIGKGINWFHTVIWPSILMSAGVPVPRNVFVHGYVNVGGAKVSKSGVSVDPMGLIGKYGADAMRYFLLREIPFGEDGDFTEEALVKRINGELAADLGNLASRVLTLAEKFDGKIEGEPELEKDLKFKGIEKKMDRLELHHALDGVWNFIRACNKYINDKEPWKLEGKELGRVLYNLLEGLRVISILVSPFIPGTAGEINRQLGVKAGTFKDLKFRPFRGKPKKGRHLFERVK
jgi:methionyl-tRNA synthetase